MAGNFTPAMTAADSVLWSMERDPQLRSTVTAIAVLDQPPDMERLRRRVEEAAVALPRLRQRVAEMPLGLGHPRWVDAAPLDLGYHLRTVAAVPGDERWLLDFAASLAEAGFDRSRPLWEMVVVEGLGDGRAALVQKVHHSLTDGVGGIELLSRLLDWVRNPRSEEPIAGSVPPVRRAPGPAGRMAGLARGAGRQLPGVWRSVADPAQVIRGAWRTGGSMLQLMAPSGRRRSRLLGAHSNNWRFETHEEPMDALQRAARDTGSTLNDVFVAAVAGGLSRYHLRHGHETDSLRINIPMSLRRSEDPLGGNRFTPVRFTVPISEADPARRIRQIGALCQRWRHDPALPWTDAIAGALSLLPPPATALVMGSLLKGVDLVATNVAGVPERCYLGGAELLRQYGFAPLEGAALNIALVSHAGTACIGVNMDRAAVADPDVLMQCLVEGFAEVSALGRTRTRKPVRPHQLAVSR